MVRTSDSAYVVIYSGLVTLLMVWAGIRSRFEPVHDTRFQSAATDARASPCQSIIF